MKLSTESSSSLGRTLSTYSSSLFVSQSSLNLSVFNLCSLQVEDLTKTRRRRTMTKPPPPSRHAQIAIKTKRTRASRRMGLRISRRTGRRRLGLETHLDPQVCFISFVLHTLLTINHLAHSRFTTSPIPVPPPHPPSLKTRVGGAPVFFKNVFFFFSPPPGPETHLGPLDFFFYLFRQDTFMCLFFFLLFLVPSRTRARDACLGVFFFVLFLNYFLLFFVVLYLETHLHVSSFFFFFFFCCSLPRDTFRCLECFFFLVVLYLETHLHVSSVYFFFSFVVLDLETHLCVSSVSFFFFLLFFTSRQITYLECLFFLFFYIVLDLETHLRRKLRVSCYWPLFRTLS